MLYTVSIKILTTSCALSGDTVNSLNSAVIYDSVSFVNIGLSLISNTSISVSTCHGFAHLLDKEDFIQGDFIKHIYYSYNNELIRNDSSLVVLW